MYTGVEPQQLSNYKLLTFYEHTPATRMWNVHFVVTKNNTSFIEVCIILLFSLFCVYRK